MKSWKYTVNSLAEGNTFDETQGEGDCEVGFHYKRHYGERNSDPPSDGTLEEAWVGGKSYTHGSDGLWRVSTFGFAGSKDTCTRLAQGADANPFPFFDDMLKHGNIASGDKKTVNGIACHEWKVTMLRGNGSFKDVRTVCLDDNHLPVEMVTNMPFHRTTYSALNEKFFIELPSAE